MSETSGIKAGDIVKSELPLGASREVLTVLASETFTAGEIGGLNSAGKVVQIATLADDVYTLTMASGTDGGSFALAYRGKAIAAQAYNVAIADLQVALRALHADLDACVVATPSGVGVDYTVTVTQEKKSDLFHLSIVQDSTADGGVWEGGIHISRTTFGQHPSVIALEAAASTSDVSRVFLVRDAVVDTTKLTGGSGDVYKRLAEPKVADDWENCAGYGRIVVRTGPTYTTL